MPIIFDDVKKILFIHIPKTGGTSIEEWLSQKADLTFLAHNPRAPFNHSPQHMTWKDIQFLFCALDWDYCFSIVRCPYRRAESEFAYRHRSTLAEGRQTHNFNTWLEEALESAENDQYYLDNHIRPQSDFLAEEMDIFRYEDGLSNIIQEISSKTGFKPPKVIPHSNKMIGNPKFDWSSELLKKFNDFYKSDFDLLKYKMRNIIVREL